MTKNAVVIGATGDVGRGITRNLLANGYKVIAVGREQSKLGAFRAEFPANANLQIVVGTVADEQTAKATVDKVRAIGPLDVVITTVNGPSKVKPVFEQSTADAAEVFASNVLTHYAAAKAFIPEMPAGGVYIGIGGGMADLIFPGTLTVSMGQAALRNFYRHLAKEPICEKIHLRELMLYSMINGKSKAGSAHESWITDDEVGKHVVAVLADLKAFEGPILTVKSRKQIGLPERKPEATGAKA